MRGIASSKDDVRFTTALEGISPGSDSGHTIVGWVFSDDAEAGGVGIFEVLGFFLWAFCLTE